MGKPLIFNIQKFSVHDGKGIRTSIFFKGCPLSCLWCHNPESQRYRQELIFYHSKCTACGRCIPACPNGCNTLDIRERKLNFDRSKCTLCGKCADVCLSEAREIAGKIYTVDELVAEAMKDEIFYQTSGGGVTLSGGEVMAQDIDFVEELCRKLYEKGVSVYIDTSGYCPYEKLKRLLPYTDVFLYDVKLMDLQAHQRYIGVSNERILENLKKLSADGAGICIRIPTIGKVNATDAFMMDVIRFLKENHIQPIQVNLLPYHDFAQSKYTNLDRHYEGALMSKPGDEEMEHFKELFQENGFANTNIGG